MKVFLASDHAGFEMKGALAQFLRAQGHEVEDMGPHERSPEDDYPDYCIPLAQKVAAEPGAFGIVIGGSGQGEAMAANRVRGARAVVFYGGNTAVLKVSRGHNDANILSLGARFISQEEANRIALAWLSTSFPGEERHVRRIKKLDEA